MRIQAIDRCCPKPHFVQKFNEQKITNDDSYVKSSQAQLRSIGASALLGAVATGIATCVMKETVAHKYTKASFIGVATAITSLLLTHPVKVYAANNRPVQE